MTTNVTFTFTLAEPPPPDEVVIYWCLENHLHCEEVVGGPTQTELMEAAMCLWEEVLRIHRAQDLGIEAITNLYQWWVDNGTSKCRRIISCFAEPCHEAWVIAHRNGEGFDGPFDWEFVPWFVNYCIDWTEDGPVLKPDWRELAAGVEDLL